VTVEWPHGHRFAFTVFDDTDWTTLRNGPPVYDLLGELDIHVTKSVWMLDPGPVRTTGGGTCEDPDYLDWVLSLQSAGHEIGYHNASDRSSTRQRTRTALDRFEQVFGHPPRVGADHGGNREALGAGAVRVSGVRSVAYRAASRVLQPGRPGFSGSDPSSPYFWGDLAVERISYWRRFTWSRTDLADVGPVLYRDPTTPYVPAWFDSSHAPRVQPFLDRLAPAALERMASAGGLCILYTHFGVDFVDERGRPDPRVVAALTRLREMDGWFVPVGEVLDHLRDQCGVPVLDEGRRARHEWAWIADRLRSRSRFGPRVLTHEVQAR
jgi:hypothetical protein